MSVIYFLAALPDQVQLLLPFVVSFLSDACHAAPPACGELFRCSFCSFFLPSLLSFFLHFCFLPSFFHSCIAFSSNDVCAFAAAVVVDASASSFDAPAASATSLARLAKIYTTAAFFS